MKTHYELLGITAAASEDEIKRSFRREIARYHPDKVQHLGPEFQEIAATRAAELTEAYRVLMDQEQRRRYDEALAERRVAAHATAAARQAPATQPAAEPRRTPSAEPRPAGAGPDPAFQHERATTTDFVRKAALGKLRGAIGAVADNATSVQIAGFDVAVEIKPPRSLFRKSDPQVRLLARFVRSVDGSAVAAAWPLAAKSGAFDGVVCVLLLGAEGMAPQQDLAHAISEQRRKARNAGPVVVPVDVRDWDALFPPDAPSAVRAVVQRLREGEH